MLRRAALLLAGVFARVSVLSSPQAQAQTWKKKRPKKAKVNKAESKAKKNRRANKKRRPANKASREPDRHDEVIVESSYTRVLGVPENQAVFQMDGDDRLVFGSRFQWSPGSGPLSIRFLGFVDARSEPSYALRPALRLSGRDHLSIEIAGVVYGGPATSLGGIQKRNDEIQLTVQYGL